VRRAWVHMNADVGTIEVRDELDDDGSETPTVTGKLVPKWARFITRIRASGALDGAAIGSGLVLGYLEGGIDNGDNKLTFIISGGGGQVATGTQNLAPVYESPPLNVPVEAGARMKFFSEVFGDAENDTEAQIAVQFSDTANPGGAVWTRSYTADADTADGDQNLTGDFGSDTTPPLNVPPEASELGWVSGAFGYDQAADGTTAVKVVVKHGPIEDDQSIPIGGQGSIAGQAGSDEGWLTMAATNAEVYSKVIGSDLDAKVRGETMGDDPGSGQIGATLWFR